MRKMKRRLILAAVALAGLLALYFAGTGCIWIVSAPRCEIHGVRLRKDTVNISYGHWTINREVLEENEARAKLFPHSKLVVEDASDLVSGSDPQCAKVRYCGECRLAEAAWHEQKKVANQAQKRTSQ